MKKIALVLGSSKGVGSEIRAELINIGFEAPIISSHTLDTSNKHSVSNFLENNPVADVLVFNTGGPPKGNFFEIRRESFEKYHQQLFLSFVEILQKIEIRKGGYIFVISSHLITEPNIDMVLSEAYRAASWVMLKGISKYYAGQNISCLNIALGPILTDRLRTLNSNILELEKSLPMGRAGSPAELAKFIRSIIEHEIKYLSGININFDGGISSTI